MKKLIAGLFVLTALAGAVAAAPDFSRLPEPIDSGDILVSAAGAVGFGTVTISEGGISGGSAATLFGGLVKVDYALPIPFTVGVEGGYLLGKTTDEVDVSAIPILARFAWHPNWGVKNLDTYLSVKAGYSIMQLKYSGAGMSFTADGGGISFGGDIGARYFFTPTIGIFAEMGALMAMGQFKLGSGSVSASVDGNMFIANLRVGITFKF